MKVFYIGRFSPAFHSDIYIANAMEAFGWKVIRMDSSKLCRLEGRKEVTASVRSFKPKLTFVGVVKCVPPDFFSVVRTPGSRVVVWYGDQRGVPATDPIRRLASGSDLFLITNSGQLTYFKKLGAKRAAFWPLAADPEIFKPVDVSDDFRSIHACEVAFTGSEYDRKFSNSWQRSRVVYEVGEHFTTHVYGRNWKSRGKLIPMGSAMMHGCAKVLSCCDLALGINNYFDIRQYQSHRTWTNMACGCCLMNRYEPGLDEMFENHVHQVFWNTRPELIALCREYLRDDEKRNRVRMRARELILERHTFLHRIQLLDRILRHKSSGIKWDQRV